MNIQINFDLKKLGYVWFMENTKKRKKNAKKNDFLMFDFVTRNTKENKI